MYPELHQAPSTTNPWRALPACATDTDADPAPARPLLACATGSVLRGTEGACRLDALQPGAALVSRSGAVVHLRRTETLHISRLDLHRCPQLAPIRFDPGTLPGQVGDLAVLLSPDCPVFTAPDPNSALGGAFPAAAFCNGATVRHVIPDGGIDYVRICLSEPAEICIGGLWVRMQG